MSVFDKLFKFVLKKQSFSTITETSEKFEQRFPVHTDLTFESDEIVSLSADNFIDATDPMNIAKYKNNLRLLVEEAKRTQQISQFMIIRNDNFLPNDWIWSVASKNTGMEYHTLLSYEIRCELIRKKYQSKNENKLFDIPLDDQTLNQELSKIDKSIGKILQPVRFRSTKHFTINTPLSYTGEYNFVDSDRDFFVMDYIDNFINSGYGYSCGYRDAYLDVSHVGLPISERAIVLISQEKYNRIIEREDIKNLLKDKHVIVYKGDSAVAINMLLTEYGILPSRPGNLYFMYDLETQEILERSMLNLCRNNKLLYNQGHGNTNGRGGHFSDLLDSYNGEYNETLDRLANFLNNWFKEYDIQISSYNLQKANIASFVKKVGVENLLAAIDEYNRIEQEMFYERNSKYREDRATITPRINFIFKKTLDIIKSYLNDSNSNFYVIERQDRVSELIKLFFHSEKVEEQLLAAENICKLFNVDINNYVEEDNFTKV